MKLVSLDIPHDPAAWPEWLERQLVGLELVDLILQLQEILGEQATAPRSLKDICGPQLSGVLSSGLSALNEEQVRQLLQHPPSLLELQARIVEEGGDYWTNLPLDEEHQRIVDRQWSAISTSRDDSPDVTPSRQLASSPSRRRVWSGTVAAALLLIGAGLFWMLQPQRSGWGFDRPGLLSASISAPEYLNSLANAAGDWFQRPAPDRKTLERRITEFIHGCDTLIAAPHEPLTPQDRDWLVERCAAWKEQLSLRLAELQNGQKTVDEIRDETDGIVNKLIAALKARATSAA